MDPAITAFTYHDRAIGSCLKLHIKNTNKNCTKSKSDAKPNVEYFVC